MVDRYDEILAKQLVMNRETWASLQKHGVTQESQLQLDFSYNASSRAAAEALAALIRDQTDYEVTSATGGSIFRRTWRVEGSTRKTQISLEILTQWVTWMVTAGRECKCDFDGWGALV